MPPTEEVSDAFADVVINGLVCPAAGSVGEVGRPTAQQTVQLVAHVCPGLHVAWHQNIIGVAPANQPVHFLDRVGRTATGPVTIGSIIEIGLKNRFQQSLAAV
jgi:hypothetical protein